MSMRDSARYVAEQTINEDKETDEAGTYPQSHRYLFPYSHVL